MILKSIIKDSWFLSNGYIDSASCIDLLEQKYIQHNLSVLKQFKHIAVATTYSDFCDSLIKKNEALWKKYFPDCHVINVEKNRGHGFGIADSENALINLCKSKGGKWALKSSNDVIFNESILGINVPDVDFIYLNGFKVEDLKNYNFNYTRHYNNYFYPQTNFYFIRADKIDYLYNENYINETYEYIKTIKDYNNCTWDYIDGWSCENFLKQCVERNDLKKYYLLDREYHIKLCKFVRGRRILDPAHKNMMISGICHFQFPEQKIHQI